jgi:hypothetical protein
LLQQARNKAMFTALFPVLVQMLPELLASSAADSENIQLFLLARVLKDCWHETLPLNEKTTLKQTAT